MKTNTFLSRRRFLRDVGLSAAAVPFVLGLDSLYAKAAAPPALKKRLIVMYSPNGTLYTYWRLPKPGADLDISDGTLLSHPNLILNPLKANAGKLMVLDRLSAVGARQQYQLAGVPGGDSIDHPGGHQKGMGNLLTGGRLLGGINDFRDAGMPGRISVDQQLATLFQGVTKFPSLQIGVQTDEDLTDRYVDKRLSYLPPDAAGRQAKPQPPVVDPFVLFNQLFGGVSPSDPAALKRRAMDQSVLDGALADFRRLQPKLSAADRMLLQHHSDSISTLEAQLTAVLATTCDPSQTRSKLPTGIDPADPVATHRWAMDPRNFQIVGPLLMDIMVQAVACGLTNIATFQWLNSENNMTYSWLPSLGPLPADKPDYSKANPQAGHHGMSHERNMNLVRVDQMYAGYFNQLIDKLSGIQDSNGTGTLLDNSLLMWTSCLGDGASHHSDNMPFTLAGSNGGYFRTGRCLRFNDVYTATPTLDPANWLADVKVGSDDQGRAAVPGKPDLSNSDLMVSILNSFGVQTNTFGDPAFVHGALPGLAKV